VSSLCTQPLANDVTLLESHNVEEAEAFQHAFESRAGSLSTAIECIDALKLQAADAETKLQPQNLTRFI
jgi:hypothetical protein